MAYNITEKIMNLTLEVSKEEFIRQAHSLTAVPAIIIVSFFILIIFLIVGLTIARKSPGRFMKIFSISFVFILVIVIIFIFSPNIIQKIAEVFINFFT